MTNPAQSSSSNEAAAAIPRYAEEWKTILRHAETEKIETAENFRHSVYWMTAPLLAAVLMKLEVEEFWLRYKATVLAVNAEVLEQQARKSGAHGGESEPTEPTEPEDDNDVQAIELANQEIHEMRVSVSESIMLNEAAWSWIGEHLDDYMGRFELLLRDPTEEPEEIWDNVVDTRRRCDGLRRDIEEAEAKIKESKIPRGRLRGILRNFMKKKALKKAKKDAKAQKAAKAQQEASAQSGKGKAPAVAE